MSETPVTNEAIVELPVDQLLSFTDHPFRVLLDCEMMQLMDSIKTYGILTPLIVRPKGGDQYELISGHRRKYAAQQLGMQTVPALIRNLTDEEAIIAMVDSNLQREVISPSEKAYAYKMKYDILRRPKGGKCFHRDAADTREIGRRTVAIIGEEAGESPRQIQRYLKLTELIPELMKKLDDGIISFHPAVELADLTPEEQSMVIDAMDYAQASPSLHQAQMLKKLSKSGELTQDRMFAIMSEVKKGDLERVTFKTAQLQRYFPKGTSIDQMRTRILQLLKENVTTVTSESTIK